MDLPLSLLQIVSQLNEAIRHLLNTLNIQDIVESGLNVNEVIQLEEHKVNYTYTYVTLF